jgi:hypothetical protein
MGQNAKSPPVLCAPAGFSGFCDWLLTQARQLRRHVRHMMMVVMTMVNANLHLYATYRFSSMLSTAQGWPGESFQHFFGCDFALSRLQVEHLWAVFSEWISLKLQVPPLC